MVEWAFQISYIPIRGWISIFVIFQKYQITFFPLWLMMLIRRKMFSFDCQRKNDSFFYTLTRSQETKTVFQINEDIFDKELLLLLFCSCYFFIVGFDILLNQSNQKCKRLIVNFFTIWFSLNKTQQVLLVRFREKQMMDIVLHTWTWNGMTTKQEKRNKWLSISDRQGNRVGTKEGCIFK